MLQSRHISPLEQKALWRLGKAGCRLQLRGAGAPGGPPAGRGFHSVKLGLFMFYLSCNPSKCPGAAEETRKILPGHEVSRQSVAHPKPYVQEPLHIIVKPRGEEVCDQKQS